MRYIFLYFYRWLKSILLNFYRICFCCEKYEYQRYVPGDLVAVNSDDGKFFVEVLDGKYCGVTRLKPYYKLKSVMREFDSSKYFQLVPPNRRATPWEMRKYALFLSQLKLKSGDWYYNNTSWGTDIRQVLKVEMSNSPFCRPYYTISSFSGVECSTLTLTSNNIKLPSQPKFRYNQKVYLEPINKQGVVVGARFTILKKIMYDVSVDRKTKYYYEDELLEFQRLNKMENTTTETKVFEPLFKAGDKVKIIPPKDKSNYRFGYVDEMQKLEGKTAVITRCTEYTGDYSFPDDGYVYRINIGDDSFDWSSQSFVKVESAPLFKVGDKVKIVPPKDTKEYRYGYDDNKKKLEFQVAVITERHKYNGCFSYPDDGYEYKIDIDSFYSRWSSQSFMKVEELQQAIVSSAQADITSVRVDGDLLTTYPIQCGKLSILDCVSDDWSAKKEEKEDKKYKLNFKIK